MGVSEQAAEKTYRAIGRFIFEFSQAEYAIRHYLAAEIGLDEEHFAIVESYDVSLLCTVATKISQSRARTQNAARIKELIKQFRSLNDERNRVAHGLWVPFKEGGTLHHVPRDSLTPKRLENQAEALEKLADETCRLRAKLENAFLPA